MREERKPDESDSVLAGRLRDGDLTAFDALFEKYRRGILAYVNGVVHDRALAEDIVQDCFMEMARRAGRMDPGRSISGWLYRVARNRAIDALRHRKFEVLPGDNYFRDALEREAAGEREGPASGMMEAEWRADLRRAMDRLPEQDRDLLLLRFYGGLTFEQAARVLRRPLGTVLWKSRRILARLRVYLKAESGPDNLENLR